MSMLKCITIENLRSIKRAQIEIAPLTILYGPNGSGKSTVFHALAFLRNIVSNPAQQVDSFFNTGIASFGGFEQVVFEHAPTNKIELKICSEYDSSHITYGVSLAKKDGQFELMTKNSWDISLAIEVAFPYSAIQEKTTTVEYEGISYTVSWNGILARITSESGEAESGKNAQYLATALNSPVSLLQKSDFVHLKRGFSKPHYGIVPLTPTISTEDEVATLLANDMYLEGAVSNYLEQIFKRDLRVRPTLGTSLFRLNTTDKITGLSTELVNDGFGINQVVYLLSKSLQRDRSVVCIEEPEIHLHPKAQRNLASAVVRIVKEENKTMIISTHSEHFVLALLGIVSKGQLSPDDVSFYLCTKEKESTFERQPVHADGQVEGGLATFMEGELEDIESILGVSVGE